MFKIYTRAIIINDDNHILLLKKNAQQKIGANAWMCPGGTLEFGEDTRDSLQREVEEEVGLEITEMTLVSESMMMIDDVHWVGLYYLCETEDFDAINMEPTKTSEIQWFDFDSLPQMKDKELLLTAVFGDDEA